MTVMSIAASGMQSAMQSFGASAANIVAADLPAPTQPAAPPTAMGMLNVPQLGGTGDIAGDVVNALEAANSFRANLAVFQTGAAMFKSLIDTVA